MKEIDDFGINRKNLKSEQNFDFIAHRREKDGQAQSLWNHLNQVSVYSGQAASKIGLQKQGELIGLLHDLGKASAEFDTYIRSATGLIESDADDYVDAAGLKGKIDHSTAGAQFIYQTFCGKTEIYVRQILSMVIASHHSGLIDCLAPSGDDVFSRRMHKAAVKTHFTEAQENLSEDIKQKIESLIQDKFFTVTLNSKLKVLQENGDSPDILQLKFGLLVRFLFSCLIDADRLDTANFEFPHMVELRNHGNYEEWSILAKKLDNYIEGFEPEAGATRNKVDTIRKMISEQCFSSSQKPKGLFQLTVPTGGGKTLASLRFAINHADAHKMKHVFYFIPFTSIADQNAEIAKRVFEKMTLSEIYEGKIVLEHHSNLTPDEESTRQRLLSENWDAPIVFTTMVQFLETLFGHGTRSVRRLHQMANSILIFDEIQTLPIRCVHLFNVAIRFLIQGCGATVVLCTATQPLLDKVTPIQRALRIKSEQQMVPDVGALFKDLKRVEIFDRRKIGGWTDSEVKELVADELKKTGSVLIVVNTKKSAASLYAVLHEASLGDVLHLSTSMCPAHRMKVLNSIRQHLLEEVPIVCVSTQLIEAGVDVDFGSVVRYLAGLDSIAQAAGRCNRNGRRPEGGRVYIINPVAEKLNKLRDIKIGQGVTEKILYEFKIDPKKFDHDIIGPKAMKQYYQYYFYRRADEMSYNLAGKSAVGRDDDIFSLLSTNSISLAEYRRTHNNDNPAIPLQQSFMSAAKSFQPIEALTRGVVVPYEQEGIEIIADLCAAESLENLYPILKKAQRYTVNLFFYKFDDLVEAGIVHEVRAGMGIFYLDEQYYSKDYGVSDQRMNHMNLLIVEEANYGEQG